MARGLTLPARAGGVRIMARGLALPARAGGVRAMARRLHRAERDDAAAVRAGGAAQQRFAGFARVEPAFVFFVSRRLLRIVEAQLFRERADLLTRHADGGFARPARRTPRNYFIVVIHSYQNTKKHMIIQFMNVPNHDKIGINIIDIIYVEVSVMLRWDELRDNPEEYFRKMDEVRSMMRDQTDLPQDMRIMENLGWTLLIMTALSGIVTALM